MRNTNFLTAKGSLVREILYPSEFNFKFHHDSEKFILIGFFISLVATILVIPFMLHKDYSPKFILDCSLNMFTITVPPALPAALAVGTLFAIQQLKKANIFCISPMRVNLAARIKTFVFDKTGTLTEDSISIFGFRAVQQSVETKREREINIFMDFQTDSEKILPEPFWWLKSDYKKFRDQKPILFLEALASCHAITYVNEKLVGDPLDVSMF